MDRKIFNCTSHSANFLQSLLLLAIRLYWGFFFFFGGVDKFANITAFVAFFQDLGLAASTAYLIATLELVCGAMLFFGFFSRLAALVTALIMLGAYWIAHPTQLFSFLSNPFYFVSAPSFSFLMASLVVLFFGAGMISIDAWLVHKKLKKENCCDQNQGCSTNSHHHCNKECKTHGCTKHHHQAEMEDDLDELDDLDEDQLDDDQDEHKRK